MKIKRTRLIGLLHGRGKRMGPIKIIEYTYYNHMTYRNDLLDVCYDFLPIYNYVVCLPRLTTFQLFFESF